MSVPTYYVVAPAECSSNLSRFDGVRFGYRCEKPKDLLDLYKRSRGEGFGAEVKRRIMTGTYVLSAGYFDAYYLKAQKVRRLITDDFRAAFGKVDLLIGPTTPTPAFDIGAKIDDPVTMYLNDIYTIGANLAGLPGLSLPCGFVDGLPMGLQLIGPHFSEAKLLERGASIPASRPIGISRSPPRVRVMSRLGSSHRAGDPRAARHEVEDFLGIARRPTARRPIPRPAWSTWRIPACCRC